MTTWQQLEQTQRDFIQRYLKRGFFGFSKAKVESETNSAIINAFGDYDGNKGLCEHALTLIPADYTADRQPLEALLAQVHAGVVESGDFHGGAGQMGAILRDINALRADLTAKAEKLRDETNSAALPNNGIFTAIDIQAVANDITAVNAHLGAAGTLPTAAQMTAARAAYDALEITYLGALSNMDEDVAADVNLRQVWQRCDPYIQDMRAKDFTIIYGLPQYAALDVLKTEAEDINTAYVNVPNDADAKRALMERIDLFVATDAKAELETAAATAFANLARAIYTPHQPSIEAASRVDLSGYAADPLHAAQLVPLQTQILLQIATIETALSSTDLTAIDAVDGRVTNAGALVTTFNQHLKQAELNKLQAELTADGGQTGHVAAIIELKQRNESAAGKVIDFIAADKAQLGGRVGNTDFINERRNVLAGKEDERGAAVDRANAAGAEVVRIDGLLGPIVTEYNQLSAKMWPLNKTQRARKNELRQEHDQLHRERTGQVQIFNTNDALVNSRDSEIAAIKQQIEIAKKQRAMLDAISFGPLSANPKHPLPADRTGEMVELFGTSPDLASQACRLASKAKDPDTRAAIADMAIHLGKELETNFSFDDGVNGPRGINPDASEDYAKTLLDRTALIGQDYADEAKDAIRRGVHLNENSALVIRPAADRTEADRLAKENAAIRATQAADAMLDRTGGRVQLDFTSPKFTEMMEMQKFGVGSGVVSPSTMMNIETEKLRDFFTDPTLGPGRKLQAETILNNVQRPTSNTAKAILCKGFGLTLAEFDAKSDAEIEEKMQMQILKSMVTPVAQGKVGSCFVTSGLLNLRESDPLRVMGMYADIANDGRFHPSPTSGITAPVPAVRRLPDGDDVLLRSLEYTVAAAAASLDNSREAVIVNFSVFESTDPSNNPQASDLLAADYSAGVRRDLFELDFGKIVEDNLTFTYDATYVGPPSPDGRSNRGRFVAIDQINRREINSDAEFVGFLRNCLPLAVAEYNRYAGVVQITAGETTAMDATIRTPAFVTRMENAIGDGRVPWRMSGGGLGEQTADLLYDLGTPAAPATATTAATAATRHSPLDLVAAVPGEAPSVRAVKVVKAVANLGGGAGKMTMIGTEGIHSFNALPADEGDLGALNDTSAPPAGRTVDTNLDEMLITPGRDLADNPINLAQTRHLFDKQMESEARFYNAEPFATAVRAAAANRPTVAMTPEDLRDYIEQQMTPVHDLRADSSARGWAAQEATRRPPGLGPDAAEIATYKTERKAAYLKSLKEEVNADLANSLDVPTIAIADSNWGDENSHQQFVIGTDPITGDPCLYTRDVITGRLKREKDKWLNAKWDIEQP